MTYMIERAARAAGITPEQAVLAIKAMREPSRDMVSAVREIGGSQVAAYARAAWPTMIDAALGEQK